MNKKPVDLSQLRLIIESTKGITRGDLIEKLSTNTGRLARAQKEAFLKRWLFVQTAVYCACRL